MVDQLSPQPVDPLAGLFAVDPMPQSSGPQHNSFMSRLGAGFTGLAGDIGETARAAGVAAGLPSLADWGKQYAAGGEARQQAYLRSGPADQPWYTPGGMAQTLGGAIPGVGAAVLGGIVGGPAGAAAAMYPQMVGANVRAGGENLDQAGAVKALALGVPEAAIMSVMPKGLGNIIERGAAGKLIPRVLTGGAVMGGVGGVANALNTGIMQEAYNPDMPLNERAKQVVDSFFSGAVQGGVFGGVLSGMRKTTKTPDKVTNDDLVNETAVVAPSGETQTVEKGGLPAGQLALPPPPGPAEARFATSGEVITPAARPGQGPLGLPAPPVVPEPRGPLDKIDGSTLKASYDAFMERGMAAGPAEVVQRNLMREELTRRTQPGLPLGEGNLLPPEAVAARAPQVEALKAQTIADVPKEQQDNAFFKNFNAANEPELINAIKAQADSYRKLSKAPQWFKNLANNYGIMDDNVRTSPANEIEDLSGQRTQAQDSMDKATVGQAERAGMGEKIAGIDAKIAKFQVLDELHKQADVFKAAATNPVPVNIATPTPDLTPKPVVKPDGLDPKTSAKWDQLDAIVQGDHANEHKEQALALQEKLGANETVRQQDITKLRSAANAEKAASTDFPRHMTMDFDHQVVQVDSTHTDPYLAGTSQDGKTVYVDSRVPHTMTVKGVTFDPRVPLAAHETAEHAAMTQGETYQTAHRTAGLVAERRVVKNMGVDWKAYQEEMGKMAAETQKTPGSNPPTDLYTVNADEASKVAKGESDAVQKPGATGVDARQQAGNGQGVGVGDAQGGAVAGARPEVAPGNDQSAATAAGVGKPASEETHWETARRLGLAGEQQPIVPEVKAKVVPRAQRDKAALFSKFDAEPDGPRKAAMSEVLSGGDPKKVRAYLEQLAKDEAKTGVKPSAAAVAGGKGVPTLDVGGVPEWANVHARDLGGQVISHNADHALIRATDDTGRPFYNVADRATGTRLPLGSDANAARVGTTKQAELLARAGRDRAADEAAARANPDGPFKGATQNVVGTKNADPRVVGMVSDWASQLGMGKVRILIAHPDDMAGNAAIDSGAVGKYSAARVAGVDPTHLGHMNTFGPGGKDFYIYIKPGMSDILTTEIAAHEMGHIIERVMLHNAPIETQRAINNAFDAFYKQAQGLKGQDLLKLARNRAQAFVGGSDFGNDYSHYLTSKSEWFADQVSRWATTAEKPRSTIEKFFAALGQKLRDFMSMLTGNKFMPSNEVADFLNHMQPDSDRSWLQGRGVMTGQIPLGEPRAAKSAPGSDDLAKQAIDNLQEHALRTIHDTSTSFVEKARKGFLTYQPLSFLAKIIGDRLPAAQRYVDFNERLRSGIEKAKNKLALATFSRAFMLPRDVRKSISEYLTKSQFFHGDASKSWADQGTLLQAEDASAQQALHRELTSMRDGLRAKGALAPMEDVLKMMKVIRYQELVAYAHKVGEAWFTGSKEQLAGHGVNPDVAFQMNDSAQENVTLAHTYYRGELLKRLDGITARVAKTDALLATLKKGAPGYQTTADSVLSLRQAAREIHDGLVEADKGTYVPLGRSTGDYVVSGKIKVDASGHFSQATAAAIEQALNTAGFNVGVSHFTDSNVIMSRTESLASMERLADVFRELQKAGHLDESEPIKSGHPEKLNSYGGLSAGRVKQALENFKAMVADLPSGEGRNGSDQIVKDLMHQWLDMMPGGSLPNYMQHREGAAGHSKDALGSAFVRAQNSARSSTAISTSGELAGIMQDMREKIEQDKLGPNSTVSHDAAREIMMREAQKASRISVGGMGIIQKISTLLSVGANPAYVPLALSQIITLGHPELAKKFGYAKSAVAIGSVTSETFKIVRAVLQAEGHWDSGVRGSALDKGGVSRWARDVVLRLENRNNLSSTYSSSMLDTTGAIDPYRMKLEERLGIMGRTAEMIPRILVALAAHKLTTERGIVGAERDNYIEGAVNSSQFDWSAGESSRLLGKGGMFGAYTPISFGFKNWQNRMLMKYYTEMHDLFKGDTAQTRQEAGMFLASHFVAVVAIAGTMGLPGVNFLSGAADRTLKALTGKDDIDVQGLYRTWLAHTFGKEVGDVVAKGLPRGLGVDMSKIGTEGILPGSQLLMNKRKWEDAWEDFTKSMAGAAPNQIITFFKGARDMTRGDYLLGATRMLPEGLKGLAEAEYAREHGYVDRFGTKLTAQPNGSDLVMMALGFDPARLAHANEQKFIAQGLEEQKTEREQNISLHLVKAMQQHDPEMYRRYLSAAVQFQRDHIGEGGPLEGLGTSLAGHIQQGVMARAMGMPPGVGPLSTIRRSTGF